MLAIAQKKRGATEIIAIIAFVLAIVMLATSIGLYGNSPHPILTKATGVYHSGTGCYLEDQYFTDTSLANNPEQTYETLASSYPNAQAVKDKIIEILSTGKSRNINPAIVLGIWNGEQAFKHPEKAFGYQYYDNGTSDAAKEGGWEFQLNGVYVTIQKAIDARQPYDKPANTNILTRLFYHYATAMKNQYDSSNGIWLSSYNDPAYGNPYYVRLNVMRLLVPNQIKCQDSPSTVSTNS